MKSNKNIKNHELNKKVIHMLQTVEHCSEQGSETSADANSANANSANAPFGIESESRPSMCKHPQYFVLFHNGIHGDIFIITNN